VWCFQLPSAKIDTTAATALLWVSGIHETRSQSTYLDEPGLHAVKLPSNGLHAAKLPSNTHQDRKVSFLASQPVQACGVNGVWGGGGHMAGQTLLQGIRTYRYRHIIENRISEQLILSPGSRRRTSQHHTYRPNLQGQCGSKAGQPQSLG